MIRRVVEKQAYRDKVVRIRVPGPGRYKVVVRDAETNRVIRERRKKSICVVVEKNGKRYVYHYVELVLPFTTSLIKLLGERNVYRLVVEVI